MRMTTVMTVCFVLAATALSALVPVRAGSGKPEKPDGLPVSLEAGFKAWSVKCSQCHDPQRAYKSRYSDEKAAQALVSRMARKPGAGILPSEQKKIAAYIAWYNSQGMK